MELTLVLPAFDLPRSRFDFFTDCVFFRPFRGLVFFLVRYPPLARWAALLRSCGAGFMLAGSFLPGEVG